jgi:hypothetical protein
MYSTTPDGEHVNNVAFLRLQEKLVLSTEQETLRVHGRAARAMAQQVTGPPLSVCSILRDQEIYNPIDSTHGDNESRGERGGASGGGHGDDDNKHSRQRYNGRQFIAWLREVDDKFDKIKVSASVFGIEVY